MQNRRMARVVSPKPAPPICLWVAVGIWPLIPAALGPGEAATIRFDRIESAPARRPGKVNRRQSPATTFRRSGSTATMTQQPALIGGLTFGTPPEIADFTASGDASRTRSNAKR